MDEPIQETQIGWASERHIRIFFRASDNHQRHDLVHRALTAIRQAELPGLVDVAPAYSTLLLEFSLACLRESQTLDAVRRAISDAAQIAVQAQSPIIKIPVCYDASCAPDIEDVARFHSIDVPELIRLHSQPVYTVQFIGFAPGFGYLGGLPETLATPRLDTPRVRVPAGSVGIAGDQTGIYPTETAGGWRLIGRTPLALFNACREPPSLLTAGVRLRFVPIDRVEFDANLRGTNHLE